jgi:hypothetical protein
VAVYAGSSKRRRTTILVAAGALLAGLVIGIVIGHATAPTLTDKIRDGRNGGRDLVTALQVLPLEYGQALSGSEGTSSIGDTVDRAAAKLTDALNGAPWLGPAQRGEAIAAVRAVRTAAGNKVAPPRFQAVVDRSSQTLEKVFGLPESVSSG